MDPQNNIQQLQELFNKAQEILVLTKPQPTIDGLCSSLAFYHALSSKTDMQGKKKNVVIASSGRGGTQYKSLPGSDKIVSELGLRDFVIGVNGYIDGAIQNVNWYTDKGRLNVVFKANPNVPMQFDLKNLDPFYAGANFDVVVVIDVNAPADLGNIYRQDPGMFSELPVVNISNDMANTRFGRINIVDTSVKSVSELVYQLTQVLQILPNADTATLFLTGIRDATNELQNKSQQSESIVNQLNAVGAKNLDLNGIKQEANNPPLSSGGAATIPTPGQFQNQQTGQFQQGYVPQGMYQYPPNMYGQVPPGYYPPPYMQPQMVPPQGFYQQQQQYPQQPYPGTVNYQQPPTANQQQQYPEQYQTNENEQQANYDQQNGYTSGYEVSEEVPSIAHDQSQNENYIPTVEPTSYQHVEPSIDMHNMPNVGDYYSNVQPQQYSQMPQNIQENKEQNNPPDFTQPPQGFIPAEKRS